MGLAGLPLSSLLGIFAAAGAVVVVFYVLKLRRRAVPVPFSRIWDSVLRDKQATELFSKLRRLLSLLLQLALLALLVLALGDPRPKEDLRDGRHLVLLIDGSASMKATDVKPSRLAQAKAEAEKIVRGMGAADRAIVVQMGSVPTPRSSMSGDQTELLQAIAAVSASDTSADLEAGLAFARDSLRGLGGAELVVIGDGAHGDAASASRVSLEGAEPRFVPIGSSGKNLSITEFSVRRYPLDKSRYEVMLEVGNLNDTPADVELELSGDGVIVDVTRLKLGPNERLPRFYQDLAGASRTLTARIKAAPGLDELPADDTAYALLPERRRARILLVTPGNTYLEAALLLDEYLDVEQVAPGAALPDGKFDVAIFDGVAPPLTEQIGSVLYLNPPAAATPVPYGNAIEDFGFDTWDRKTPVLRFMSMGDIQVAKGRAFKPRASDRVLGASDYGPILVSGAQGGHKFVALGFDPRDSDLVLRIAWPLFVLNTINAFIEEDTGYVSSFRTGEVWHVAVPGSLNAVNLLEPGGGKHVVPVSDGRAVFRGELAGFYKVTGGTDEAVLGEFAANLSDLDESRIAPAKELTLAGKKASAVSIAAASLKSEVWIYLLLAVIAVSLIEWITYHRRVTV